MIFLCWNAKFVTARVKDNNFRKCTIWVPVWRSEIAMVTAIFTANYERNNGNHHRNTTSCFSNPLLAFTWLRTAESVGSVHNNLMPEIAVDFPHVTKNNWNVTPRRLLIQYPMLLAEYFTNQMLWKYDMVCSRTSDSEKSYIIFVNVIICYLTVLRIKQFKIYGAQFIDMLLWI